MKTTKRSDPKNLLKTRSSVFSEGMRDGLPIALGYFAVSFSLGVSAKNAGLTAFQGFLASLLTNASAGEYAGFVMMATKAAYIEFALMILVANARYLLMSCALSQKFSPKTKMIHRFLVGFDVTDEIFGITIARKGALDPFYTYGAMSVSIPAWAIGTSLGIIAGNVLPWRLVSALSVALYGMFLAIIIPPARKDKATALAVTVSFVLSFACAKLPLISEIAEGTRTLILTVIIATAAAILFPRKDTEESEAADE